MTAEFYALKGMFLAQINKYVHQCPSFTFPALDKHFHFVANFRFASFTFFVFYNLNLFFCLSPSSLCSLSHCSQHKWSLNSVWVFYPIRTWQSYLIVTSRLKLACLWDYVTRLPPWRGLDVNIHLCHQFVTVLVMCFWLQGLPVEHATALSMLCRIPTLFDTPSPSAPPSHPSSLTWHGVLRGERQIEEGLLNVYAAQ